ncbi:MAG: sugar phosphate nucleotidyltransferase [Deltaproteobacteria bacterium]|nr:sugar phosphate nucleotidyltransferase [Deltaproteobacteria bacterium]
MEAERASGPCPASPFQKQFLAIGGTEPMLARTVRRVEKLVGPERTLIVTGRDLLGPTADCVPWLTADNLLAEPAGRNTAPCVGLAARLVSHRDRDAVMAVLPADHVIADEPAFRGILEHAARLAAFYGAVVTLAIPPRYAETGYGYMELGERIDDDSGLSIRRVDRFHEKTRPRNGGKICRERKIRVELGGLRLPRA